MYYHLLLVTKLGHFFMIILENKVETLIINTTCGTCLITVGAVLVIIGFIGTGREGLVMAVTSRSLDG